MKDWRTRVYIFGVVGGILTGLAAAYVLIQRSEALNNKPKFTAGDGVKVGLAVLGLVRMVADFADQA